MRAPKGDGGGRAGAGARASEPPTERLFAMAPRRRRPRKSPPRRPTYQRTCAERGVGADRLKFIHSIDARSPILLAHPGGGDRPAVPALSSAVPEDPPPRL